MKKLNGVVRMQQLAGILTEIKVNNPSGPINLLDEIGFLDLDAVKSILIKTYPEEETIIEEYVDDINSSGEPDGYSNISEFELKKDYEAYKKDLDDFNNNQLGLTEIKVNNPNEIYQLFTNDGWGDEIIAEGNSKIIGEYLFDHYLKHPEEGGFEIRKSQ